MSIRLVCVSSCFMCVNRSLFRDHKRHLWSRKSDLFTHIRKETYLHMKDMKRCLLGCCVATGLEVVCQNASYVCLHVSFVCK